MYRKTQYIYPHCIIPHNKLYCNNKNLMQHTTVTQNTYWDQGLLHYCKLALTLPRYGFQFHSYWQFLINVLTKYIILLSSLKAFLAAVFLLAGHRGWASSGCYLDSLEASSRLWTWSECSSGVTLTTSLPSGEAVRERQRENLVEH